MKGVTKPKLVEINKKFSDGRIRDEGCLNIVLNRPNILSTAKYIASMHPFWDGNKRTAINFMEKEMNEMVPDFVYKILSKV